MITALGSVRMAVLQAYLDDCRSQCWSVVGDGGGIVSSTDMVATHWHDAPMARAIDGLPDELRHWVLWAYGPGSHSSMTANWAGAGEAVLDQSLGLGFDIRERLSRMREPTALRAKWIIRVCMKNYVALACDLPTSQIARKPEHFEREIQRMSNVMIRLDIKNRNFKQNFGWVNEPVRRACEELDRQALPILGAALSIVRERSGQASGRTVSVFSTH